MLRIVVILVSMLSLLRPALSQTKYSVREIGGLGAHGAIGQSVNNRGDVTGMSNTGSGIRSFIWSKGTTTDLGWPVFSDGFKINNRDQIVIFANLPTSGDSHGLIWDKGKLQDMGTLGGDSSVSYDINDAGEAVGYSNNVAFVWERGSMQPLQMKDGAQQCIASAINSSGEIAGTCQDAGGLTTVMLWRSQQVVQTIVLPSPITFAFVHAMNNKNQVVGSLLTPEGFERGFYWESGSLTVVQPLDGDIASGVVGINDRGKMVGFSSGPNVSHSLVWRNAFSAPVDLSSFLPTDIQESSANGINESGQIIVSSGGKFEGRSFLLTPIEGEGGQP